MIRNNALKRYVPDGDCSRCKVRKNCLATCEKAKRNIDKQRKADEEQSARIHKALMLQYDHNNDSFRYGWGDDK